MLLLKLTGASLWNRRGTVLLTLLTLTISIALLLGVEYVRKEAKASFLNSVSGTDLVVGARSGPVQLLLYSVFRIGNATNNIGWDSYQHFAQHPQVAWSVPLSLGDSHRGYRVLGTTVEYFQHYRYADKQTLRFASGQAFSGVFEVVLGAEVARKLSYGLGDRLVIAHGAGETSFALHDDKPFTVVGILAPTGTPVDRTLHVPLEGIEAIHADWVNGAPVAGYRLSAEEVLQRDLQPKAITAFLVGLKNRATAFRVQREINDYRPEPLLAIIPGVALAELWQTLGTLENVLRVVSMLVVLAGLLGMLTTLLASLNERRREMAILRAVGAHPHHIFLLLVLESLILVALSCLLGMVILASAAGLARPWLVAEYGLYLRPWLPDGDTACLWLAVLVGAALLGLLPGLLAYRRTLQDGLTVRL